MTAKLNTWVMPPSYTHYWSANYCHDSYYTTADYPYYWANPDTGYVVWWPLIAMDRPSMQIT